MAQLSPDTPRDFGDAADLIEDLGAELAAVYSAAEVEMIAEVSRIVAEQLRANPAAAELVTIPAIITRLRRDGARIAAEVRARADVEGIIRAAATEGKTFTIRRVPVNGADIGSARLPARSAAVEAITEELGSNLDQMTTRIVRWMPDVYRSVVASITRDVVGGSRTLADAQTAAVEQFLAKGVTGFTDKAGRSWKIGTYAEMATRTAVNRAYQTATIEALTGQGINLVTIVIGIDACAPCAAAAGRVWSIDGTPAGTYQLDHATEDRLVPVVVAGTLDEARAAGWNHPNCRCVVAGYFNGLAITGSTYSPERERNRDELRRLERRVRDLKRKEAAAFDDVSKARYRARIRNAQRDIRDHIADTGIMRKPYREQLSFSDGAR